MFRPNDHPDVLTTSVGVLLVNLGTPDGTDYFSMRRYLKEFLSDRRIIEAPRLIWWPILNGIILSTRPQKSGKAYEEIWMTDTDESPLRFYTRSQAEKLQDRFSSDSDHKASVHIDWAMRYGQPSIADGIDRLLKKGCRRIFLMALYPQYSAATTATVYDKAFDYLKTLRWQPAIRTAPAYHDQPAYIEALAASVKNTLKESENHPDMLLCSFHGLPKENLQKGDPYHCYCQKTGRLLREALGWPEDKFMTVFQSRFGPKEWLQPYADVTVADLAKQGVKSIAVISPGFISDCVETLEEINIGLRETFIENGGEEFHYIPCLNDGDHSLSLLETMVRRELSGWI